MQAVIGTTDAGAEVGARVGSSFLVFLRRAVLCYASQDLFDGFAGRLFAVVNHAANWVPVRVPTVHLLDSVDLARCQLSGSAIGEADVLSREQGEREEAGASTQDRFLKDPMVLGRKRPRDHNIESPVHPVL